jgi:hypothetical protein
MASQLGPAAAKLDAMPSERKTMVLRVVFMVIFPSQIGLSLVAGKQAPNRWLAA